MESYIAHLNFKGQAVEAPIWVLSLQLTIEENIQQ